jgi:D-aminoacyl-tRNA deacylase
VRECDIVSGLPEDGEFVYHLWRRPDDAMRCVIQRVSRAAVRVGGETVAEIGPGLLILAAVQKGDAEETVATAARKIAELRIFSDPAGKMNLSVKETGGQLLAVSQFTLAGSIAKGRRPSFDGAEDPTRASELFDRFVQALRSQDIPTQTGVFREMMEVELVNDGPVTFVLDVTSASAEESAARGGPLPPDIHRR